MDSQDIRVRIAPSPTGNFHIGTARSALFNWLFAKKHGGKFIVRIEDTDKERSTMAFEENILQGLKWLGLDHDEFARQSELVESHKKYVKQLIDEGKAYLDEGAVKLRVDPTNKIIFDDAIRGRIEFDAKHEKDFVIARNLDSPLFHLAVVVDDYEMRVSHIIRGEDHIANTAKHILLQQALGFTTPIYAHLPLILAPDKSKLSKRHGAVSLDEYKAQGYLADALFNYLAILGFTAPEGQEILSREELIKVFDLEKIHKAGAIFDTKKLDWINGEYIKKMSDEELLMTTGQKYEKILPMVRERMKKKSDLEEFDFFFEAPVIDREMLKWKKASFEESKAMLKKVAEMLQDSDFDSQVLRSKLDALGSQAGDRGLVYWPLRVALSGRKASPDPVDIAVILGKEEVLRRIENVNLKMKNDN